MVTGITDIARIGRLFRLLALAWLLAGGFYGALLALSAG
jgi:hypothetical protein